MSTITRPRLPRLDALALLTAGAVPACLFVAYILVTRGPFMACVLVTAPLVGYWLISRQGNGYLLAVGVLLVIPYFWDRVWLIAPLVAAGGLTAGLARMRLRGIDLIVGALVLWLTWSWVSHSDYGITTRQFVQTMLPFQFYLWTRVTLTERLLLRLQWVMLLGGAAASLTILYETARGSVLFFDPSRRYQWAGSAADVFRGGGIYAGAPTAGIILAVILLASLVMLLTSKKARAVGLVLFVAMVLTYSRSALVALVGGVTLIAVLLPYRRWRSTLFVAAVLALPAIYVFTTPSTLDALTRTKLINSGLIRTSNSTTREVLFDQSLPLAHDSTEHLLAGRGFDAFISVGGRYDQQMITRGAFLLDRGGPHDDYMRAVLEQGLIGLGLVLAWLLGALLLGVRKCRSLPRGSPRRMLTVGLTAAVGGYFLAGFFHDLMHNIPCTSIGALVTGMLVSVCTFPADDPEPAA